MRFKLITQVSFQKAFTRIIQSIFIIVTADRGVGNLVIVCKTPSKLCVIELRLERETDGRSNSFLDKNVLAFFAETRSWKKVVVNTLRLSEL